MFVYPVGFYGNQKIIVPSIPIFLGHTGGSSQNQTITTQADVPAGYAIVCVGNGWAGPDRITGVSDDASNSYSNINYGGDSNNNITWNYVLNANHLAQGSSISVTFGRSGASSVAFAFAIPGVAPSAALDINTGTSYSGTDTTFSSGTLSQANEIVLAAVGHFDGGHSWNVDSPFTMISQFTTGGATTVPSIACAYILPGSTNSVSATFHPNAGGTGGNDMISLKLA